jgi:hypothetical protein
LNQLSRKPCRSSEDSQASNLPSSAPVAFISPDTGEIASGISETFQLAIVTVHKTPPSLQSYAQYSIAWTGIVPMIRIYQTCSD